ncbi:MAG: hypothetical protein RIM33_13035 [Alphaproteobacteria bacterium]
MKLVLNTPTKALWFLLDRKDAGSLHPGGVGWTETWSRADRHQTRRLLKGWHDKRELAAELRRALSGDGAMRLADMDDDDLIDRAAERFVSGWVVEVVRHFPAGGWSIGDDPPAPVAAEAVEPAENPTGLPEKEEKDHFIIVELLGENGEPIPNELCRITLPDGEVVERETNSQGRVEEYSILEGDCDIEFPELDKDAWEPYTGPSAGAAA